MKEGEPITIAEFGEDRPDGKTELVDFADKTYWKSEVGKQVIKDARELRDLREKSHHPDCPCKQCTGENLRRRRELYNRNKLPNES
jgi:hypothetical protein